MSLKKINPIKTESWTKLKTHFNEIENKEIKNLLSSRSNPSSFNLEWNDFNIDISKNRVDNTTLNLLLDLAKECKLDDAIAKQFNGSVINETEKLFNNSILLSPVCKLVSILLYTAVYCLFI